MRYVERVFNEWVDGLYKGLVNDTPTSEELKQRELLLKAFTAGFEIALIKDME